MVSCLWAYHQLTATHFAHTPRTAGEWRSFEGADKYIGGIWTDSQHDVYEGNWLAVPKSHQSTKDGRGRLLFANGDVFDGDWVNDVQVWHIAC